MTQASADIRNYVHEKAAVQAALTGYLNQYDLGVKQRAIDLEHQKNVEKAAAETKALRKYDSQAKAVDPLPKPPAPELSDAEKKANIKFAKKFAKYISKDPVYRAKVDKGLANWPVVDGRRGFELKTTGPLITGLKITDGRIRVTKDSLKAIAQAYKDELEIGTNELFGDMFEPFFIARSAAEYGAKLDPETKLVIPFDDKKVTYHAEQAAYYALEAVKNDKLPKLKKILEDAEVPEKQWRGNLEKFTTLYGSELLREEDIDAKEQVYDSLLKTGKAPETVHYYKGLQELFDRGLSQIKNIDRLVKKREKSQILLKSIKGINQAIGYDTGDVSIPKDTWKKRVQEFSEIELPASGDDVEVQKYQTKLLEWEAKLLNDIEIRHVTDDKTRFTALTDNERVDYYDQRFEALEGNLALRPDQIEKAYVDGDKTAREAREKRVIAEARREDGFIVGYEGIQNLTTNLLDEALVGKAGADQIRDYFDDFRLSFSNEFGSTVEGDLAVEEERLQAFIKELAANKIVDISNPEERKQYHLKNIELEAKFINLFEVHQYDSEGKKTEGDYLPKPERLTFYDARIDEYYETRLDAEDRKEITTLFEEADQKQVDEYNLGLDEEEAVAEKKSNETSAMANATTALGAVTLASGAALYSEKGEEKTGLNGEVIREEPSALHKLAVGFLKLVAVALAVGLLVSAYKKQPLGETMKQAKTWVQKTFDKRELAGDIASEVATRLI